MLLVMSSIITMESYCRSHQSLLLSQFSRDCLFGRVNFGSHLTFNSRAERCGDASGVSLPSYLPPLSNQPKAPNNNNNNEFQKEVAEFGLMKHNPNLAANNDDSEDSGDDFPPTLRVRRQ